MTHASRLLSIIKSIADRDGLTTREEVRDAWRLVTDLDGATDRKAFYRGLVLLRHRGLIQVDKLGVIVLMKPPRGTKNIPVIIGVDEHGDEIVAHVPEKHVPELLDVLRGKPSKQIGPVLVKLSDER